MCIYTVAAAARVRRNCMMTVCVQRDGRAHIELHADEAEEGRRHTVPAEPAAVARVDVDVRARRDRSDMRCGEGDTFRVGAARRGATARVVGVRHQVG